MNSGTSLARNAIKSICIVQHVKLTLSWNRSDAEKKLHKAAKAKLMTGIEICLSKEPDNPIVRRMADKYAY